MGLGTRLVCELCGGWSTCNRMWGVWLTNYMCVRCVMEKVVIMVWQVNVWNNLV